LYGRTHSTTSRAGELKPIREKDVKP